MSLVGGLFRQDRDVGGHVGLFPVLKIDFAVFDRLTLFTGRILGLFPGLAGVVGPAQIAFGAIFVAQNLKIAGRLLAAFDRRAKKHRGVGQVTVAVHEIGHGALVQIVQIARRVFGEALYLVEHVGDSVAVDIKVKDRVRNRLRPGLEVIAVIRLWRFRFRVDHRHVRLFGQIRSFAAEVVEQRIARVYRSGIRHEVQRGDPVAVVGHHLAHKVLRGRAHPRHSLIVPHRPGDIENEGNLDVGDLFLCRTQRLDAQIVKTGQAQEERVDLVVGRGRHNP